MRPEEASRPVVVLIHGVVVEVPHVQGHVAQPSKAGHHPRTVWMGQAVALDIVRQRPTDRHILFIVHQAGAKAVGLGKIFIQPKSLKRCLLGLR